MIPMEARYILPLSLGHFKHIPASNLSLFYSQVLAESKYIIQGRQTHKLKYFRELFQRNCLKRSLDQSTGKEIDRLLAIPSVANIASLDIDHANHSIKNRCSEERASRNTNDNDSATRTHILGGLLERLLRNCKKEDRVGSKTTRSSGLDISHDVGGFAKVDECLVFIIY